MDERKLGYFLAVVEEGTVTRAARRLRVAQPSLSQALRALEAELGIDLFHRVGRTLRLSSAGEQLIGPARQIVRDIRTARSALAQISNLSGGTLELAALATLTVDPLAALVGRFRREHHGVEVRILEPDSSRELGAWVREGACEIGVTPLPLDTPELVRHELGSQELLFTMPPGSDAAEGEIGAEEVAGMPLVVTPPGTSTRTLLEQALAQSSQSPTIAVQTTAREAIVPLVLAGAGAALLPAPVALEAERRGAVVRPLVPAVSRQIALVHRVGPLSPAARAFVGLVSF